MKYEDMITLKDVVADEIAILKTMAEDIDEQETHRSSAVNKLFVMLTTVLDNIRITIGHSNCYCGRCKEVLDKWFKTRQEI